MIGLKLRWSPTSPGWQQHHPHPEASLWWAANIALSGANNLSIKMYTDFILPPSQKDWIGELWGHLPGDQHHKWGGGGCQIGVQQSPPSSAAVWEQAIQDSSGMLNDHLHVQHQWIIHNTQNSRHVSYELWQNLILVAMRGRNGKLFEIPWWWLTAIHI